MFTFAALLNREMEAQQKLGYTMPNSIALGCMIEVPSLLYQLDEVMQRVDFVSVGSNDLFDHRTESSGFFAQLLAPLSRSPSRQSTRHS